MVSRGTNGFRFGFLVCAAWLLAWAPVRAEPISLATLGDSITDTYIGQPYAGSNLGWTDQLRGLRGADVTIHNLALAGSTSTDLLKQGQAMTAANLAKQGVVGYATLLIGANDIGAFLQNINPNNPPTLDPTSYVKTLVSNINTAVNTLQAAGNLHIVLSNLPDIGHTPRSMMALARSPALLQLLTNTTLAANAQIAALARARGLPLVDLYALNNLSILPITDPLPGRGIVQSLVTVGGINVQGYLYSIDGFHPSTIGAGLLANAELEALHRAYGVNVTPLSDAEILKAYGLTPSDPSAHFDVSPFVIDTAQAPEPASLSLLVVGAVGLVGVVRRRQVA